MPNVGTITADAEVNASGFIAGMAQAAASLNRLQSQMDRMSRSVTRVLESASRIGVGFAAELEQAEVGFGHLMGSSKKAHDFMQSLAKFAAETPFEFPGLMENVRIMIAMGFEARHVIPLLRAVGDAVAAMSSGSNTERMGRVMLALAQMRGKSRVAAEEMRQLAESGVKAWEILAEGMGVSLAKASSMVRKRLVSTGTFFKSFLLYSHQEFGGLMQKQLMTLAGQLTNLKDVIRIELADAFDPFVRQLRYEIPLLTEAFRTNLAAVAPALNKGLGGALTIFKAMMPLLNEIALAVGVAFAVSQVAAFAQALHGTSIAVTALTAKMGVLGVATRKALVGIAAISAAVVAYKVSLELMNQKILETEQRNAASHKTMKRLSNEIKKVTAARDADAASLVRLRNDMQKYEEESGQVSSRLKGEERALVANIQAYNVKIKALQRDILGTARGIALLEENTETTDELTEAIKKLAAELGESIKGFGGTKSAISSVLGQVDSFMASLEDLDPRLLRIRTLQSKLSDELLKGNITVDQYTGALDKLSKGEAQVTKELREALELEQLNVILDKGAEAWDALEQAIPDQKVEDFRQAIEDLNAELSPTVTKQDELNTMLADALILWHQGALSAEEYEAAVESINATALSGFNDLVVSLGQEIGSSLGMISDVVSSIAQGASIGGPIGGVIAGLGTLLMESEQFEHVVEDLNTIMQMLANSVGVLLEGLYPIIGAVSVLAQAIGQLIAPLMEHLAQRLALWAPLIMVIANLLTALAEVLTPLWTALETLMPIVEFAFKILFEALRVVAIIILAVMLAIQSAWNAVLDAMQQILELVDKVIDVSDAIEKLEDLKADTDATVEALAALKEMTWESAMAQAESAHAALDAAEAMETFTEELVNVPEGFKVAAARYEAMEAELIKAMFGFLTIIEEASGYTGRGSGVLDLVHGLASGGIVTRPTLAVVGEQGPEAVIPLSQLGGTEESAIYIAKVEIVTNDPTEFLDELERVAARRRFVSTGSRGMGLSKFAFRGR